MKFTKKILTEELGVLKSNKKTFTKDAKQKIVMTEEQLNRLLNVVTEDSSWEESLHYGKDMGQDDKELYDLKHDDGGHVHIKDLEDDIHYDHDHDLGAGKDELDEAWACPQSDYHPCSDCVNGEWVRDEGCEAEAVNFPGKVAPSGNGGNGGYGSPSMGINESHLLTEGKMELQEKEMCWYRRSFRGGFNGCMRKACGGSYGGGGATTFEAMEHCDSAIDHENGKACCEMGVGGEKPSGGVDNGMAMSDRRRMNESSLLLENITCKDDFGCSFEDFGTECCYGGTMNYTSRMGSCTDGKCGAGSCHSSAGTGACGRTTTTKGGTKGGTKVSSNAEMQRMVKSVKGNNKAKEGSEINESRILKTTETINESEVNKMRVMFNRMNTTGKNYNPARS